MKVLERELKGTVDVIYIDPPYNTGMTDLPYDDYTYFEPEVEKENTWIQFMEERMRIVFDLLTSKGVMFIHLDDNELVSTMQLSYKIFGKKNISVLIIALLISDLLMIKLMSLRRL